MKFVIILKKLVRWLKGYVGFLCPLYLLISSLCSENTSTINSFTKDELGGLPFGLGRKESVEEERGIYGMSVRGVSKRHHHSKARNGILISHILTKKRGMGCGNVSLSKKLVAQAGNWEGHQSMHVRRKIHYPLKIYNKVHY